MAKKSKILNLARLDRKLKRLPTVAKTMIRQAMAESADEIVAMMKRLVPKDTGELRDSIGWTWGAAPKGSMVIAALKGAGVGGGLTITIFAGNSEAYHARWVEFGTQKMPASPYFFASWRSNRKDTRKRVSASIRNAAKAVAAGG